MQTELRLPASPGAASTARHFTAEWMGRRANSAETIEIACLVASELVGNAFTSGAEPTSLRLIDQGDSVRIEVEDGDSATMCEPAASDLGLRIVQELSFDWGTHRTQDGVANWADVALD